MITRSNTVDSYVGLEKRNRVDRDPLVDKDNVLAVTMCLGGWKMK
jgi:hypothetical protein